MIQQISIRHRQYNLDWKIIDELTDIAVIVCNNTTINVFHHKGDKPFYSIEKYIGNDKVALVDVTFEDSESELITLLEKYL